MMNRNVFLQATGMQQPQAHNSQQPLVDVQLQQPMDVSAGQGYQQPDINAERCRIYDAWMRRFPNATPQQREEAWSVSLQEAIAIDAHNKTQQLRFQSIQQQQTTNQDLINLHRSAFSNLTSSFTSSFGHLARTVDSNSEGQLGQPGPPPAGRPAGALVTTGHSAMPSSTVESQAPTGELGEEG